MATIHSLNKSITDMDNEELYAKLHKIRSIRRTRPSKKIRAKSAPAKVKRAPNKKKLRPQDMFAYAKGLTASAKADLISQLTGLKK